MNSHLTTLGMGDDEMMVMIAIGGGLAVMFASILVNATRSVIKARMHETSRREIAAYIAEGSITAEEGERLLRTGPPEEKSKCGWM